MHAIRILSSQAWVERLGWTLVHFLWQGFVIALWYAAARRALAPRANPQARYLLACAAMAGMLAAPLATWEALRPPEAGGAAAYRIGGAPPAAPTAGSAATTAALPASVRVTVSTVESAQFLAWVVMLWLAGALAFWVRLAGGWVVAARMRSVLVRTAPPQWQEILRNLGARIGLVRPVRLLVSALVEAPTVVGWLRPVVLVPVGALAGLPPAQLEALLLHELAHIRRHDYLVNLLQSVAEALLFYHPAVWWVSGHIRAEREMCCDDVAVSVSGDALQYARALARLESCRPAHFHQAVAASGGSLAGRIARILGQPRPAFGGGASGRRGTGVLAVASLLAAAAYGLFGQSGARPSFEVASVKPSPPVSGERFQQPVGVGYKPGGRMLAQNATLMLLIQFAYAAHDNPLAGHSNPLLSSQVIGGPSWIDSIAYNIEAKPAGNTDPKHAWLMLQTLLAERFKLALHRETRELPVYDLTVAKNGPRLPAAKDAGCVSFPPGTSPHPVPGKVDCGYVSGPFSESESGQMHMKGRRIRTSDLARELALVLDRPVLDKTGFTGEFDLDLTFAPDQALRGAGLRQAGSGIAPEPGRPNIFAALEEQYGVKLVPAKGPVEVLVVDHAEKPAPN